MKLSTYFGIVIASGIFLTRVQSIQKTHACEMLIAIDGSLYEKFDRDMDTVNQFRDTSSPMDTCSLIGSQGLMDKAVNFKHTCSPMDRCSLMDQGGSFFVELII